MKKLLALSMASVLVSCVTPTMKNYEREANVISVGMTKQQVMQILGKPRKVSASGGKETLLYGGQRAEFLGVPWNSHSKPKGMSVTLENGKVTGYRNF